MENNIIIASNRIPFFYGTNFLYWKCKMESFIKATDFSSWQIIQYDDKQVVLSDKSELDENERKKLEMNNAAKNTILISISQSVFAMISSCKTAKKNLGQALRNL